MAKEALHLTLFRVVAAGNGMVVFLWRSAADGLEYVGQVRRLVVLVTRSWEGLHHVCIRLGLLVLPSAAMRSF